MILEPGERRDQILRGLAGIPLRVENRDVVGDQVERDQPAAGPRAAGPDLAQGSDPASGARSFLSGRLDQHPLLMRSPPSCIRISYESSSPGRSLELEPEVGSSSLGIDHVAHDLGRQLA